MKNNSNGFAQATLLLGIIIGAVVVGVGYFVFSIYENNKHQAGEIETLKEQLTLKSPSPTPTKSIAEQKSSAPISKPARTPTVVTIPSATATPTVAPQQSLSSIIKEWRKGIAYVKCRFSYTDGTYIEKSGTGLFFGSGTNMVMSNLHVLSGGGVPPDFCAIKLPEDPDWEIVTGSEVKKGRNSLDVAYVVIENPTSYMQTVVTKTVGCKEKPDIGEKVVVLGYPGIGANLDITATEGIVSGYEAPYYITSAKIEHGNSGGVAIWVEKNCNLGIPTLVATGTLESLGRILDFGTALLAH